VLSADTEIAEKEKVFDAMAERWDVDGPKVPVFKIRELIEEADVCGKIVLDVGAGTGILLEEGLAAGCASWIACDISKKMLLVLERKIAGSFTAGPNWSCTNRDGQVIVMLCADAHRLPLESESVDRIICHNAFPHFKSPPAVLENFFRVLTPGGIAVINHFAGRNTVNQIHLSSAFAVLRRDLLMPGEELGKLLKRAGFEVVKTVDTESEFRVVARKAKP